MFRFAVLAVTAGAVAGLLIGCGGTTSPSADQAATAAAPDAVTASGPEGYVQAVGRLLAPPAEMAGLAAGQGRRDAPPRPARSDLDALVMRAEAELAALRALDLASAPLARQRDRLATAYDDVVARMRDSVEPVSDGRRARSRRAAFALLESIRSLPSATS